MALDELKDDDSKIEANGIELIYNERDKHYFKDSIIDFQDSFWGRGLVIRPSYSSGGGCC